MKGPLSTLSRVELTHFVKKVVFEYVANNIENAGLLLGHIFIHPYVIYNYNSVFRQEHSHTSYGGHMYTSSFF